MDIKKPSGIKGLVGRRMKMTIKFMDEDVIIFKLTVAEILEIQEQAKKMELSAKMIEKAKEAAQLGGTAYEETTEESLASLKMLMTVIRNAVDGGSELTDEDFLTFPMDELSKLSSDIMKYSGIGQDTGK